MYLLSFQLGVAERDDIKQRKYLKVGISDSGDEDIGVEHSEIWLRFVTRAGFCGPFNL